MSSPNYKIRSFQEWLDAIPTDLRTKARKNDEENIPLLNQINYIWVENLRNNKPDLNPTSFELIDWITTGQIEIKRRNS